MDSQSESPTSPPGAKKIRKACSFCMKKKIKCSGERPNCLNCRKAGRKCVYQPYQKRISVLLSHYKDMKSTIIRLNLELEKQRTAQPEQTTYDWSLNAGSTASSVASSASSSLALKPIADITSGSSFVSGSSDRIVRKLAEMETHEPSRSSSSSGTISGSPLQNSSEMKKQIDDCGVKVHQMMRSLSLKDAINLVDRCHFFLNDIYFPYDVEYMKLQLAEVFRPITNFTTFLQQDNTYFKPLVLLTFALGKRYFGTSNEIVQSLVTYSLLLVTPVTRLRAKRDNYLLPSIYTMASFYFRSVNMEEDSFMYSNLALQYAAHINLYKYETGFSALETELKSRIMWVCFGTNRILSAKMGNTFLLTYAEISNPLPKMVSFDVDRQQLDQEDSAGTTSKEKAFYAYIELMCIAEEICKVVYTKESSPTLTSDLGNIIKRLISWNARLPDDYKFDSNFSTRDKKHMRLICSMHLNYCFCIHLTTIPILYSLVEKKKTVPSDPLPINPNLTELITICVNAAEMTLNVLLSCHKEGALALFGVMDLDYLFSASLSFFMCGEVLRIQPSRNVKLLDRCIFLLKEMARVGNDCAQVRCDRLQDLLATYRRRDAADSSSSKDIMPLDESILEVGSSASPLIDGANGLPPETSWAMDPSVVETFQGLTDADLNIWEDGYKSYQQLDSYWDEFQRSIFDGNVT